MSRLTRLFTLLITAIFLLSCASPGGTVGSTGTGSSSSGGSNTFNIIAAVAAVGTAWYATEKATQSNNRIPPTYLPILRVERQSDNHQPTDSTGYVVFQRKASGVNTGRHVKFCRALIDKFISVNAAIENISSNKNSNIKTNPTIWPIIDNALIDMSDCHSLLKIYDETFKHLVHLEYDLPQGQGPLLIAFNSRFEQGMAKKQEIHGIYWDASEYNEEDFPRLVDTWYHIMSRHPENWPRIMKSLDKNERITRTLKSFR